MNMPREPGLQTSLQRLRKHFASAGIISAELDARLLMQAVTGFDHAAIILKPDYKLTESEKSALNKMEKRRLKYEPVSRILAEREFFGRRFLVTDDVLDPRADTEKLVECALAAIDSRQDIDQPYDVLDLGTGTGAIVISLLCEVNGIRGLGTDASAQALNVARKNSKQFGLTGRLDFQQANWCQGIARKFEMIVSNPPYVVHSDIEKLEPDVKYFDPLLALDGGEDGLRAYHEIARQCPKCLKQGGLILLEIGFNQANAVVDILRSAGFQDHKDFKTVQKDLGGNDRVVTMQWNR